VRAWLALGGQEFLVQPGAAASQGWNTWSWEVSKTLQAVHAQGVRLSMDDFGTGYSSLSYLRRLPVSELKLDRSFVADLENDEAAQALSNAILGIGRSLHLTVVAEGVETGAQNTILREQGYPVAQGYLFSRPLPADAFERWMQDGAISPAMPTKSNNK
jgi:EAL domain-containing protein (putative c-di-GMP-specific phosphodiesterase class I)